MDLLALMILASLIVLPALGTVYTRYRTRKRIAYSRDVSWSEFEAAHGEAECKEVQ